jgi:hypothetical protein
VEGAHILRGRQGTQQRQRGIGYGRVYKKFDKAALARDKRAKNRSSQGQNTKASGGRSSKKHKERSRAKCKGRKLRQKDILEKLQRAGAPRMSCSRARGWKPGKIR